MAIKRAGLENNGKLRLYVKIQVIYILLSDKTFARMLRFSAHLKLESIH